MNNNLKMISILVIGILTGISASILYTPKNEIASEDSAKAKPSYWVAPMNPNYRSDKPGKSPMGMDLIPVYEDGTDSTDFGSGAVKISPAVINKLGMRTSVATFGTLQTSIKTVGYVQYDQDQLIHINPRVEGWIEELYVKASGDPVIKGQPIYSIYSPALVNAQEEMLLALNRNDQRLITASEARLKALLIPSEEIKALRKNRIVKQNITFYADQSGVIDNLNVREGSFVKPGMTMFSIGSLTQVWVEAEVFERQANMVKVGQEVEMKLDYLPGQSWQGKVDYVYPALDSKTRTLKVRLRFDNTNAALKPNMFAQVSIKTRSDEDVLLLPREAVIRTGNSDRVVLALGEGKYKSVAVTLGRFDDDKIQIKSGLYDGDVVVSSAQFLLDSESNKTSDLKRMRAPDDEQENIQAITPETAWVEAKVNSLMAAHRMINVNHQAVSEWEWPQMTMDFIVDDSVDFSVFTVGAVLHIELEKTSDGLVKVVNIHNPKATDDVSNTTHQADHSGMEMGE
ncbi:efflux RND transporter periplasmic adaptor subunit [Shewanella phaeophyticola]|uniref:Efflux RND transporter periplasmic adaptor subunit n=1 Tax=Shewanella phaeophyticola TaxID=2978345 RepID=A0ABT2P6R8_9GAMM|nr:efflux RND transporter periplasmic adaptor subunit [Shewanella sp. KJ10-1]MCT8988086.1 efflux RND transporter periplasmic adaptor subunit [Shewanella sp. KJ10-1]